MEALLAVGLAGNVVQFVQFAGKFVSEVKSIRETGSPRSLPALKQLVDSLVKQAEVIHKCLTAKADTARLSQEDQYLINVAADCRKTGSEFLKYLDTLIPQAKSSNSLKKAGGTIRLQFAHHKINEFTTEIDRLQSALTLATILAFRTSARTDHEEILTRLRELQKEHNDDDAALHDTIRLFINVVESQIERKLDALNDRMQQCLWKIDDIRKQAPQPRETKILLWLTFRQMAWRYEEVLYAYQQTYSWIFEESTAEDTWDDFTAHLTHNVSKPYFINGKAGSGKSTLMKYIVDHPKTKLSLDQWASIDNMELIVTRFFFWNLGTPLQKTAAGLLRSLLWTILRERPELIPVVFPNLYQNWDNDVEEPTYTEVKRAWSLLLEKSQDFLKIAVFIDGIDEFDGDHSDLAEFVTSACSVRVKVVVSSRPINASLHAFRHCPSLRLQDLTRRDVEIYVHGNLTSHAIMVPLAKHCPKICEAIILEIKEKAEGVFLWVKLVVKLLVDGLKAGDSIEELQAMLRSLPRDLRALYRQMIFRIPLEYQTQAVEMFQLLQTWQSFNVCPIGILLLHFALRPPHESIEQPVGALDSDTLVWHCQQAAARVQSRSCGLLEVSRREVFEKRDIYLKDMMDSSVGYLHRTVGEFLKSDDVKLEMEKMVHQTFDPYQHVAAACLSLAKISSAPLTEECLIHYVYLILRFYMDAPPDVRDRLGNYITSMDKGMTEYLENFESRDVTQFDEQGHWTATDLVQNKILGFPGGYKNNITDNRASNMLTLAARLGLTQYLEASSAHSDFRPVPLLSFALDSWTQDDCAPVSINDRRDTLLFLLGKVAEVSDGVSEKRIVEFAKGYSCSDETELSVFVACFIVATTSLASWTHKYTAAQLRDMIQCLQRDHNLENQRLGIKLSQSVDERLHGNQFCSNCRTPGHTRKGCSKPNSESRKKKKFNTRRKKKRKHREAK